MSELSVGSLSGLAANSYVIDVASGSRLVQPGMIVAVKHAIFTGAESHSVAATDNVAITDLSITHEVSDPANKLIISAFIGAAGNSSGSGQVGIAIHDGTSLISVGNATTRIEVAAGGQVAGTNATTVIASPAITFVHTPGAGSKTYTVRAINVRNDTRTLYINRNERDSSGSDPRAVSSLVIQEVVA